MSEGRDERREQRDARREERRAERDERRAERHRIRAEMHAHLGDVLRDRISAEVREGIRKSARRWYFGLGDMGPGFQGEADRAEATEVVERRFDVAGMPRLRVNNVSGETEITVGQTNEVFVRARKRVRGWSEERARRLLENVEIRMEQAGDEILVEPRLFQQERGWLELFRGGRVAVDLDIRVPRETNVEATTMSGDLSITGTRGPHDVKSVSGDVTIDDVQGPLLLRSVSGDCSVSGFAGRVEANSTSGEIEFSRSRVRTPDVVTVSGDVSIRSLVLPEDASEGRVKTVSGDVELVIGDADAEIDYTTVSGDAVVEVAARIEKDGRRDRRIVIGNGGTAFRVKTVSGDLRIPRSADGTEAAEAHAPEEAIPMGAPDAPPPEARPGAAAKEILEKVARGELSVDDAAAALDEARRAS